jgi:hypothetical protein
MAPAREVYKGSFEFNDTRLSKSLITPSFDLPGNSDNLAVDLFAPVQNDWMEASIDLVNDATGKTIEFEEGVEYYSGSDSDGPWTEGSTRNNLVLSSVPGGRYHMVVEPSGSGKMPLKNFSLTLRRGVTTWSNFFVALVLLSVYPLCVWCRGRAFEIRRWSESDFSPYRSGTEEEED